MQKRKKTVALEVLSMTHQLSFGVPSKQGPSITSATTRIHKHTCILTPITSNKLFTFDAANIKNITPVCLFIYVCIICTGKDNDVETL